MITTLASLKKKAEDLPENFRDFVSIRSMTTPFQAVVRNFNDPNGEGFGVTAQTTANGKVDATCTCPEEGVCDHITAFFQYLLDIKSGAVPSPTGEASGTAKPAEDSTPPVTRVQVTQVKESAPRSTAAAPDTPNRRIWNRVYRPPVTALKQIGGGRLRGMTDINPQWRLEALTEVFGPCGIGWKYEIVRLWTLPAPDGEVFAFSDILLYVKENGEWSEPIPGHGGSMLVEKEKDHLHANDEGFKMATTDALSVACKALGVGAEIYAGRWDGSKYKDGGPATQE